MLRLRLAIGRPRWTSSTVCRRHRHHTPARATPPTTRDGGRSTLPSKTAPLFRKAASATTTRHSSSSSSGGGISIAVTAKARASSTCSRGGFFRCSDQNVGRLNASLNVRGGDDASCVYSLARARLSTASALGEEQRGGTSEGGGGGGLTSFRLTDIGEGIMEVEVLRWFVAPGDHVRQFDKLCEVQSDKANVEITSRYEGVVRNIRWSEGDMVQTGDVLVDIEEAIDGHSDGSSIPSQAILSSADESGVPKLSVPPSSAPARTPAPASAKAMEAQGGGGGEGGGGKGSRKRQVLATPAVRRLSRELSIDISLAPISGTGAGGRVLKGDVLDYAAAIKGTAEAVTGNVVAVNGNAETAEQKRDAPFLSGSSSSSSFAPPPLPVPSAIGSGHEPIGKAAAAPALGEEGEERKAVRRERRESVSVPIRGVQRAMMEAMKKSLGVPHMTFCDEVNADRLSVLRSDLKEAAERRGVRLSYLPLVVKATSMALTSFPTLNASLSEDESSVLLHPDHNIGVAMDTERGLLVPCISAVQEKSILEIAEELNDLQRLGAAGKLGEEELSGTTFTLSNIGSIGGTYASPVILHPQVCIGALGRMQRVPRFDPADPDGDKVVAARVFPASWSADHRVVDGGTLARFSNLWKAYLENPARMLADTR